MAYNALEGSLYVTLKSITYEDGLFSLMKCGPMASNRQLHDSYFNEENYRKNQVIALTKAPSPLSPYRQIIYLFSQKLQQVFLGTEAPSSSMMEDIVEMKSTSDTMVALREVQLSYLHDMRNVLNYCKTHFVGNSYMDIIHLENKSKKVSRLFDQETSDITCDEKETLSYLGESADTTKRYLTLRGNLWQPKV